MNGWTPPLVMPSPFSAPTMAPIASAEQDRERPRDASRCRIDAKPIATKPEDRADRQVDAGGQDDEGHPDPEDADDRRLPRDVGEVARRSGSARTESGAERRRAATSASRIPLPRRNRQQARARASRPRGLPARTGGVGGRDGRLASGIVGRLPHRAVQPPSTSSVVPVISDAAGEARKTTAPATSIGSPIAVQPGDALDARRPRSRDRPGRPRCPASG